MTKIEVGLENVLEAIREFYDYTQWHFLTVNGVDIGEGKIEMQWIFSRYGVKDEVVIYAAACEYESVIPSIVPLVPSAGLSEREVVDMFGVKIEGAERGLYLEEDSLEMPLRMCSVNK